MSFGLCLTMLSEVGLFMQKKKYQEDFLTKGDLSDLKGLPKNVNHGVQKRRISAQVEAGKAHIEGDEALGKLCVTALRTSGEFQRATQGFHTYPARLHPDAARLLLEALPGKSLGDPFCGGGTLLVEALMQGRAVYGSDLNPVATLVATARTALLSSKQLDELEALLRSIHETACHSLDAQKRIFLPSSILKYKDWYKTQCFEELAALFDATRSVENDLNPLCHAVFSSLVVKFSLRASDTSNKVVHIVRKKGAVLQAYADKAREYVCQLRELQTLVPPGTQPAEIALSDARFLKFGGVDTIITSPPYPGTYDYLPLQQLRQAWFDLEMKEEREIGSRRSFKSGRNAYEIWLKDTDDWMASAANALSIGGRMAIVVGEGIQAGRSLKVAKPTMNAARRAGLKFVCSASVDRKDPATNQKKIEYILVFEKTDETPKNILPKMASQERRTPGARHTDIREIKPFSAQKREPLSEEPRRSERQTEAGDARDTREPRTQAPRRFGDVYRERHPSDARRREDEHEERPRRRFADAYRERHQKDAKHDGHDARRVQGKPQKDAKHDGHDARRVQGKRPNSASKNFDKTKK